MSSKKKNADEFQKWGYYVFRNESSCFTCVHFYYFIVISVFGYVEYDRKEKIEDDQENSSMVEECS